MWQMCGRGIHRFIFMDHIILTIGLCILIVMMISGEKNFPPFKNNLPYYYAFRISSFVVLFVKIGLNMFFHWSIKRDEEWRLKHFIKIRLILIISYYVPMIYVFFWFILPLPVEYVSVLMKVVGFVNLACLLVYCSSQTFILWSYINRSETISGEDATNNITYGYKDFLNTLNEDDSSFLKFVTISKRNVHPDFESIIGVGQFGKVFKGELELKQPVNVAIKFVKYSTDQSFSSSVMSEVKTLVRAGKHKNIVKFYGVTLLDHFLGIVLELCTGGNLLSFLIQQRLTLGDQKNAKPDLVQLVKFAQQIAMGMEYLSSKQIVHADLSARNILLTADDNLVKINDFGMSLHLYNYQLYASSNQTIFPWKWMPPESLVDLKFSTQSDIWSFGVVLWEIFTLGLTPYWGMEWDSNFSNKLKNGLRLEKPLYATDQIYELMQKCWQLEEELRITFANSILELNSIIYDLPIS